MAAKQRKYNVWGRELPDTEQANARWFKAITDNPNVKDCHIVRIIRVEPHRTVIRYQTRWYDHTVARKLAKQRRESLKRIQSNQHEHECNCVFCPL